MVVIREKEGTLDLQNGRRIISVGSCRHVATRCRDCTKQMLARLVHCHVVRDAGA